MRYSPFGIRAFFKVHEFAFRPDTGIGASCMVDTTK